MNPFKTLDWSLDDLLHLRHIDKKENILNHIGKAMLENELRERGVLI